MLAGQSGQAFDERGARLLLKPLLYLFQLGVFFGWLAWRGVCGIFCRGVISGIALVIAWPADVVLQAVQIFEASRDLMFADRLVIGSRAGAAVVQRWCSKLPSAKVSVT